MVTLDVTATRDDAGEISGFLGIATDVTEQKRSEEALRESKHFAERIAENSTGIIYIFDLETRSNVYANRSLAENLGYSPAQISEMGDKFLPSIVHPENLPRIVQHDGLFAEMEDGRVLEIEYRTKHVSGEWRWIWDRQTVFKRRPNGAAWQIMGTGQDITERKRAEAALRESEELFSGAFEYAPIGVALVSLDGWWLKVNQALCDILGYSDAELRTRTFQDTIRPEDIDMSRENARRLIAGEIRSTQAEMRYVQPGGDIFTVLVNSSLVRGGHGPPRYFIAHFQDITEGKRVKEALRESEEKFRQMADTIDDSFWVSSPDLNTIQYVSAGYSRIWGRSIESLYANHRQWVESILPEDRDPVFAEFAGLAGNAPEASIEYRIARPDGTVRWIHTRGFQVRDGAGNLIRIAGIASDITERKLAQLEIERLNADLEQRVARRTQALYAATQEAEHANAAKNSANSALGSSRERSSGIFFMISTL